MRRRRRRRLLGGGGGGSGSGGGDQGVRYASSTGTMGMLCLGTTGGPPPPTALSLTWSGGNQDYLFAAEHEQRHASCAHVQRAGCLDAR